MQEALGLITAAINTQVRTLTRIKGTQGPRDPKAKKSRVSLRPCCAEEASTHLEGLAGVGLAVREGQCALDQVLQHQEVDVLHTETQQVPRLQEAAGPQQHP